MWPGSGLRGFTCQTSPTCHSHIVSHISSIGTPSISLSVCLSPISAASPSSISLKYITYNFTYLLIIILLISQYISNIFLNKFAPHSAKTVFPLLSQKDINIVFMPDMEIPGAKVLLSRFFCTFASQSQSLERQSRKFNKLTSVILSY